jgi:hypothetical protein
MIAVSLVHIAMLTNIAIAHTRVVQCNPHNVFWADRFAARRQGETLAELTVEKVVLQETTICEKCGIGAVSIDSESGLIGELELSVPIDSDTAALRDKARKFASSIDWIANRKDVPTVKPDVAIRDNWTKRFAVRWDEDGGFSLGGKYFPQTPLALNDSFPLSAFCPGFRH